MNKASTTHIFSNQNRDPSDSSSNQAVLLDVVKTTVKISGLSQEEADTLLHAWARCNARLATELYDIDPHLVLIRPASVGWTQFHEHLVSWVTLKAIESGRGALLMFHGAALSDPVTGASIILAAESGTGKTTATLILAKLLGYVTDETAAFDLDRRIYPYAKPLSLLPSNNKRPKTQYSPEDLSLLLHVSEPFVSALAILDRDRTGIPRIPEAEEIPLSEALEVLLPQMSSLSYLERGLVKLCQQIDTLGGVIRISYSEASSITNLVADILAAPRPVRASEWSALDLLVTRTPSPGSNYYRRVQVEDAITLGNDVAILLKEEYFVISGIGPAIWDSLSDWKSAPDLLRDIAVTHGKPEGAEQILSEQLRALIDQRLIEQG